MRDFARVFVEAFVTFLGIVALAAIYGFVIWEWVSLGGRMETVTNRYEYHALDDGTFLLRVDGQPFRVVTAAQLDQLLRPCFVDIDEPPIESPFEQDWQVGQWQP